MRYICFCFLCLRPPLPPKSMLAQRSFVFQFRVILDTCEINIDWRGEGDRESGTNLKLSIDHCWGVLVFWIELQIRSTRAVYYVTLRLRTAHKRTCLHFMPSFRYEQHTSWAKVKYWPFAVFWICLSAYSFRACRAEYDLETTTHKHTSLHLIFSSRYKQHKSWAKLSIDRG